jgi:hypothetical protein
MEGGPTEIEAADIDNDGNVDLLSIGDHGSPNINTQEHGIMIWTNDGSAKWTLSQNGDWGYGGIAVGDMNNDGKWDLAYSMHHNYSKSDLGDQVMEAATGDGTGKNWAPWGAGLGLDGQSWGMSSTDFGDFNNDGWLDIGSNSFGCCDGIHTYINNHDGTWKHTGIKLGGNSNSDFAFGDINADGNIDLITSNEQGLAFFGDGKGGWKNIDTGATGLVYGDGPSLGDINNDGYLDVAGAANGAVLVFTWDNSSSSWKAASTGISATGMYATALADMNNDGNIDLVAGGTGKIVVWTGDGTGQWTQAANMSVKGSVRSLKTADFDHNGYLDIVAIADNPQVFLNDATAQPSATLISPRGGERFYPGSVRFIDYMYSPPGSGTVKLELSTTGNSGPWTTIVDNYKDGGRYQWTVPSTPSKNCYVKVTAGSASGMNAKPFEILGSSGPTPVVIQVGAPNGGENWTVGAQQDVTYTITGGKAPFDVTLEYSVTGASGPWKSITTQNGVTGSGKYTWTIPNDPSKDAFVKASVKDSASQTGNDASNAKFTIYAPPNLPVMSRVSIDPSAPVTLDVGGKQVFTAKAYDDKGAELKSAVLAWTTTGNIGTVSPASGASSTFTATAAGSGEVTVTATYNGKTATNSTQITVNQPGTVPSISSITVTPSSVAGDIGASVTLVAKAIDTNGTDITNSVSFVWSIALSNIADLYQNGKTVSVTLKVAGETTITVKGTYNGLSKQANVPVKATKPTTEFPWWIIVAIVVVMIVIVLLMLILGRRKKKQSYDWGGAGPQW